MAECGEGGAGGHRRIPVVYYLSRNRHLEHPHFIEVPLSSSSSSSHSELSFLLRDFTARLNAVRGHGMAEMYSWSCKRSYKSGFVWHDLSSDDLVLPASADEYVLKGSELPLPPPAPPSPPPPPPPPAAKKPHPRHKSTSSSASPPPPSNHHTKPLSQLSVSSSPDQQRSPASVSSGPCSPPHQPHVTYHKPLPSVDASTQTDDPVTKSRSISMDDSMLFHPQLINSNPVTKTTSRKSDTLESLIRAEGSKINQFRVLEEDEDVVVFSTAGPRLSPATYLMHLISCGSISVKDYRRYGFVPIYRPTYVQVPIHSPIYATTSTRFLTRMEDKEYFSGSIVETKRQIDDIIGDGVPVLKRSSSYNADRICKSSDDWKDETEIDDSSRSRCLPRTMKLITSPLSDCPRSSSSGPDAGQTPPTRTKRITNKTSSVVEPSRRKKEKLFRIEERLTSGARVVIQSRVPCDQSEDDTGT